MKLIVIILYFSFLFGCKGQDVTISSVERKVYVNDTLHSFTVAHFEDTSGVFLLSSEEVIKGLEQYIPDSLGKNTKHITYQITLSDSNTKSLKAFTSVFQIDNLMLFDGDIDGDETFDIGWWLKKDEIETIIIPSSEFHK